jgi:hypothetical protein
MNPHATWREKAAPIVAKVIADTRGKPDAEVMQAIRDAYPFGQRAMHPYKIWCDEVAIQLGKKPRRKMRSIGWTREEYEAKCKHFLGEQAS